MRKSILSTLALFLVTTLIFAQKSGYKIGDQASDFKLKNIDGKMVSLADYKDAKGFIIVFTCNSCPFSKAYEDRMIALHKQFSPLGYPVIAINSNDHTRSPEDSWDHMQVRSREKAFPFVYLHDETQEIATAFGANRTPHTFILKRENANRHRVAYIGALDNSAMNEKDVSKTYVADAVNSLLSGKEPAENFTMAIGCTIKWKK